mgnify:CR=1 FL=1
MYYISTQSLGLLKAGREHGEGTHLEVMTIQPATLKPISRV